MRDPTIPGIVILVTVGAGLLFWPHDDRDRTANITSGYVVPARFDVHVKDLDEDGKYEVTATYDGKDGRRSYYFVLDEQGNSVLKDYKINPSSSSFRLEILSEGN